MRLHREFHFTKRLTLQSEQIPIRCLHSVQHSHSGVLPRKCLARASMFGTAGESFACGGAGPFLSFSTNLCVKAQAFSPRTACANTENIIIAASEKITSNCIFFFFFVINSFHSQGGISTIQCTRLVRSGMADIHSKNRYSSFLAHCFHKNYSGAFHVSAPFFSASLHRCTPLPFPPFLSLPHPFLLPSGHHLPWI